MVKWRLKFYLFLEYFYNFFNFFLLLYFIKIFIITASYSLFFIQFQIVTDDDMPENDQQEDNPNQNGKKR